MSTRFTDIKNKLCLLQLTKTNSYGENELLYVQYDVSQEPIYSMHELKQAVRAFADAWYPGWKLETVLFNNEMIIGDDI